MKKHPHTSFLRSGRHGFLSACRQAGAALLAASILIFVFASAPLLSACARNLAADFAESEFFAMDTYVTVSAHGADDATLARLREMTQEIEAKLSAFDDGSELVKISAGIQPSDETAQLVARALSFAALTDGAFDPTLGALKRLWNFSGAHPAVPSDREISAALAHCGYRMAQASDGDVPKITVTDPALRFDLGAVAKGYAGQRAVELLRAAGVSDACVSFGGCISVIGSSPQHLRRGTPGWDVAINNPFDPSQILGSLCLSDKTVSVSGSYERYFEEDGVRYHHILDPETGFPARSGLVSAAVIADDGAAADALSTALFVMGMDEAMAFYASGKVAFEAVFCTEDGRVFVTDGLLDRFQPWHSTFPGANGELSFPQFSE